MKTTRPLGLALGLLLLCTGSAAAADTVAERYRDSYAHEARGEYAKALAAIDGLPPAQRKTYVYQLRRGWLLYLQGRHWDAIEAYRVAITLQPRAIEPRLGIMLPEAALRLWLDVLQTGEAVRSRDDHNYLATSRMAWAAYSLGRFAQAERLYAELVELHPADVEMRAGVGWSRLKQGRRLAARASFEAVLLIAPDHASARLGLVLAKAPAQ
ncbi:MAG: tetratricopeptide repeat protein [Nannocystaceae bacterium]